MNSSNSDNSKLQDQLIDRALRETLGGEVPPDLSEQILDAVKTQATRRLSTLAIGDEAMNGNYAKGRKRWAMLIVAASLLVGVGLFLPTIQPAREAAQRLKPLPENISASRSDSDGKSNKLQVMTEPKVLFGQSRQEQPTLESNTTPQEEAIVTSARMPNDKEEANQPVLQQPADGMVNLNTIDAIPHNKSPNEQLSQTLIREHLERRTQLQGRDENFAALDLKSKSYYTVRGPRDFRREVTPHIITQEAETIKLGIVARESQVTADGRFMVGRGINGNAGIDGNIRLGNVEGHGPGNAGDQYTRIHENPFVTTEGERAVSTFSIDVDTAAYANVRQFLMQNGQLPPPDAVRIEELINYFDYDYSEPTSDVPFAANVEVAGCPWQPEHRLVRVGIKGREIQRQSRPQSNLVFLIDVSGSMNDPNKLPLLVEGMRLLTRELGENDRVAIVVYASSEGLALPSTSGEKQDTILAALNQLRAGGSTAGGAGIELAYKIAKQHFITGGVNRVILATDGDFNVGVTSPAELERIAEAQAKETGIFLTVLGFGRGNLNDAMMEKISGKGNGNYHYIDNRTEARKVLVEEMAGTLVTIAKDVKIQIEFNPTQVAGYRLIGYENRMMATEDFNDDKKDAGEIGAGHTVTALYEIVPAGKSIDTPSADPLKYQQRAKKASNVQASDELLTLKIRYKQPDGNKSTKLEFSITDNGQTFAAASGDFQFAAAVASFGMLLRDSKHRGNTSFNAVLEIAEAGAKRDPHGYRAEFLTLVRQAKQLSGE